MFCTGSVEVPYRFYTGLDDFSSLVHVYRYTVSWKVEKFKFGKSINIYGLLTDLSIFSQKKELCIFLNFLRQFQGN